MPKTLTIALVGSVAVNSFMVFVGRGEFGLHVLMLAAAFWLMILLAIVGSLILIFGRRWLIMRRIGTGAIVGSAIAMSCVVSLPLGWLVNRADIERAKEFCDRLRPELERQRQATGRYPDQPFPDSEGVRLPRLLRGIDFYHSYGDVCRF